MAAFGPPPGQPWRSGFDGPWRRGRTRLVSGKM